MRVGANRGRVLRSLRSRVLAAQGQVAAAGLFSVFDKVSVEAERGGLGKEDRGIWPVRGVQGAGGMSDIALDAIIYEAGKR